MICIIFVAGHGTRLEIEVQQDPDGEYSHLSGVPKALMPGIGGKTILTMWWEALRKGHTFDKVYLVSNADKFKYYERWATANDFPTENIINDGTTTFQSRLGALSDFDLVLRAKNITDDVMVVAGDMLFQAGFDVHAVSRFFKQKQDGDLAIYYNMDPREKTSSRGIVEVDPSTHQITSFKEKPADGTVTSRLASVVFYCFRAASFEAIRNFIRNPANEGKSSWGHFLEGHVQQTEVYGMKLPVGFQLIGNIGLDEYKEWLGRYSNLNTNKRSVPVVKRAYARVGLVGNPSDGFFGKTISLSVRNFWAEVRIVQSENLRLIPHPLNDPSNFGSLEDLHGISRKEGYLGGLRLLQATCKKFFEYCTVHGIALQKINFTLSYDTNIPRQVGLAGSSAIVTCVLQALMEFYGITADDIPKPVQPSFVLAVETEELFINAGLQDRVIQCYGGLVYMDFSQAIMERQGFGDYEQILPPLASGPSAGGAGAGVGGGGVGGGGEGAAAAAAQAASADLLPPLWLAYLSDPSDSGKIHNDVKQRWLAGDQQVVAGMQQFASYTEEAKVAILAKNWSKLGELMNKNFQLRRDIYGDPCLGEDNLRMKQIADSFDCPGKFPGSGGAMVGICLHGDAKMKELKHAFENEGFVFCQLQPNASA